MYIERIVLIALLVNTFLTKGNLGSAIAFASCCILYGLSLYIKKTELKRDNISHITSLENKLSSLEKDLATYREENSSIRTYVSSIKMANNANVRR